MEWSDLSFWRTDRWKYLDKWMDKQVTIVPHPQRVFSAFYETPFDKVKCVILGQDPYPNRRHAHGLAFSVLPYVRPHPPSLRNILKEYHDDLGYPIPRSGCLLPWARRGVLLLNSVLTVEEGRPRSHKGMGWEKLTIEVLQTLSKERTQVAFVFWGRQAQEYAGLVDAEKHMVIKAPHPSPFSAKKGFFGHRPFSRVNGFLTEPIDWRL